MVACLEPRSMILPGRVGVAPAPASKITCVDTNCTKTPSFGFESDRRRRRCCSHKLENMVYLKRRKCAGPDCARLSSYGRGGGGSRFCLLHKHPDMVDLVNRRCETLGCNRRRVFASAGQKARLCSDHRRVDMTDVANHLCSAFRCGLKACWSVPGRRATVCFIHRTEQMQKRVGGGSGTSSRSSESSISILISTSDKVKPSRVFNVPTIDAGECAVSSYIVSEVVKEEPLPATHTLREWTLPFGMMRGEQLPQPFMIRPGQHLHQHFQHPSPQSSLVPQATMHQHPGESTSMLNGAQRAYADQHLKHGNPIPASAASLLSHLRRQPQPTSCYPHVCTVAEPYSFGDHGGWVHTGALWIDSRVQQQQDNYHHASLQLQQQHHNMQVMHKLLSGAGTTFPPTSNGGEHSISVITIDRRLQVHADGISRQAHAAYSLLSPSQLPSMVDMLFRASESGGKMHT